MSCSWFLHGCNTPSTSHATHAMAMRHQVDVNVIDSVATVGAFDALCTSSQDAPSTMRGGPHQAAAVNVARWLERVALSHRREVQDPSQVVLAVVKPFWHAPCSSNWSCYMSGACHIRAS
jgi:hypothetical protein